MTDKSRMIKTAEELELCRESAKRSSISIREFAEELKAGMRETEAADLLHKILESHGMETMPYGTIVASGPNGADPHAKPSDKKIEKGEMVVVDFGAAYKGYASDITRTYFFGEITPEQRRIFDLVVESYNRAMEALKTAKTTAEVEKAHREVFLRENMDEYALRSLGHGLGLEIHEAPRLAVGQSDDIVPGMVFTIEPGLYIPGFCGVRIEDDVITTADGYDMITDVPIVNVINK